MLKREGKQVSFQSLIFGILVIVLTILSSGASIITHARIGMMEMFFFIYHLALVIFSLLIGLSAFSNDRKEGGMEYVLTLPYTRLQVLSMKVIPRLLSMVGLYLLYIVLMALFGMSPDKVLTLPVLPHSYLAIICFTLFVIGIQSSVFQGSIIVASCGAIIAFLVFFILSFIIPTVMLTFLPQFSGFNIFLTSNFWGIVRFNIIMPIMWWLASSVAFAYAFKSFDLKPKRNLLRRYLKIFIPGAIVVLIATHGILYFSYKSEIPISNYYLTQSNNLIESDFVSLKIYDRSSIKKLDGIFFLYGVLEKDNYLYLNLWNRKTRESSIFRVNPAEPGIDILYKSDADFLGFGFIYSYKDLIGFIEKDKSDKQKYLVLFKPGVGVVKKILLPILPMYTVVSPNIIGAGEVAQKKYWMVFTGQDNWGDVLRVWEDGNTESIGLSETPPYFVNGTLTILSKGNLVIMRMTETGTEVLKEIPVEKNFVIKHFSIDRNFDNESPSEIYCGIRSKTDYLWTKTYRLDLNAMDLKEIKELNNAQGTFFFRSSNGESSWYYIDRFADTNEKSKTTSVKVFRMKNEVPELLKQFDSVDKAGFWPLTNVFQSGIVMRQSGKTHVYAFPDFKELSFDKLN